MFPKDFQTKDLLYLNKMLTPGFMTIFYWILGVLVVLGALGYIIQIGSFLGIIAGLLIIVFGLLYVRVMCEILIVMFKINANVQKIADKE